MEKSESDKPLAEKALEELALLAGQPEAPSVETGENDSFLKM